MPIVEEPAPGGGPTARSFHRAVCNSCGAECPPRAMATKAMAVSAALLHGWYVNPAVDLARCSDCNQPPQEQVAA